LEFFSLQNLANLGHSFRKEILCIGGNHIFQAEICLNSTQEKTLKFGDDLIFGDNFFGGETPLIKKSWVKQIIICHRIII